MIVVDCDQGSMEWHLARRGIPTASCFDKIITPVKCEPSKSQDGYINQLIGDLMSLYYPPNAEHYTNNAIRHGQETEAKARRWYSVESNQTVEQVGFIMTDDGRFGASPDGLVGHNGGLELKCPQQDTHVGYLRTKTLPSDYKPQCHGALLIGGGLLKVMPSPTPEEVIARLAELGLKARHLPSEREWWAFMSYHDGLPPLLLTVVPDDFTAKLRDALESFWLKFQAALVEITGEVAGEVTAPF